MGGVHDHFNGGKTHRRVVVPSCQELGGELPQFRALFELAEEIASHLQRYFDLWCGGAFTQLKWVFDGPHPPKPYRRQIDEKTRHSTLIILEINLIAADNA